MDCVCVWSVVQLDHDEEVGSMRGMYGTLDAELEVPRTMKRAELTAFLCLLRGIIGPSTARADNKTTIDGLWRRNEVHWPKSEGRRPVDSDLGGGAQDSSRRNTAGRRARQNASHQEGEARNDTLQEICHGWK